MHCYPFLCWIKFCNGCFRQGFFPFGEQKEWSLVVLNRWSSYTVTIVWEFDWADSALVILDKWSSYGGGRLSRFDCSVIWCLFCSGIVRWHLWRPTLTGLLVKMGDNGKILLSFASGSCNLKLCNSEAKLPCCTYANISFLLSFCTSVFNSDV